jgi:hypothetical protein
VTVTNTLASKKAYAEAGFTERQAESMAILDEQHSEDAAEHIARIFDVRFAKLEGGLRADIQASRADFHATVRQQTWAIIAFGFAIAGIAVTIATLLRR